MRPVKEIAGDILLYLYSKQRKNGVGSTEIIRFNGLDQVELPSQPGLSDDLLTICSGSAADAYNALKYLAQKSFVTISMSQDVAGVSMHDFTVSSYGTDIIEGIERGTAERDSFYVTFNIKLADSINIESLIKNELGSLFKASVL